MAADRVELENSVERNAVLLLEREWVLRLLKLDQRAHPIVARMNLAFEIQRVGIVAQSV